jgi:hypothetical protein
LFGEDHEQLRFEDCVLAQGALIQVQQFARIGTTYGYKILSELGTKLLIEQKILRNKREDRQGLLVLACLFLVCRLAAGK